MRRTRCINRRSRTAPRAVGRWPTPRWPRYEHTGADLQQHRPERRGPREMLQRHSPRARGHDVAVTAEELVTQWLEQGQPAALGADQGGGQLLGGVTPGGDP